MQNEELKQIEQLYNRIPQQIIAKFTTKLHQYEIQSFQMAIETDFNEQSLNQLLKSLMQSQIDQQTLDKAIFEFLIDGQILRGKLKSHLVRYEISCEKVIEIEYILGFEGLELKGKTQEDDWVSVITDMLSAHGNSRLLAGLFNGGVSVYSQSKPISKYIADDDAIKALKSFPAQKENEYFIISGGINQRLKIDLIDFKMKNLSPRRISDNQHLGSILGIDLSPSLDGHLATAGSNGSVNIWKMSENFDELGELNIIKTKKKKRQLSLNVLPLVAAETFHQDSIESICWMTSELVISGSSDHSMKIIDVQKMQEVKTILTKDSITTSIDYSNDRILSSHEDGYIRLWDIRDTKNPTTTYKSHSKFASCVKFNRNSNIFASSSYDHTIKIWDCRSIFPLQNIGTHLQKVFTVCWMSEKELASGGSDGLVEFHSCE